MPNFKVRCGATTKLNRSLISLALPFNLLLAIPAKRAASGYPIPSDVRRLDANCCDVIRADDVFLTSLPPRDERDVRACCIDVQLDKDVRACCSSELSEKFQEGINSKPKKELPISVSFLDEIDPL